MSRNMGLPLNDCHCCQVIATSLTYRNYAICSLCQAVCDFPYDPKQCRLLAWAVAYDAKEEPAEPE